MLELEGVSKSFAAVEAVKNVHLHVRQGEAVGLLGPNGAGKSTLIDMLTTLTKPTAGEIRFEGKPVANQLKPFRNRIGVVPQEIALFQELSAEENLLFFGKLYKLEKAALKQRVAELLDLMELTNRKKEPVRTFSGGMKRRLNLAVALIHKPEYLILDEPTVGIDPHSRRHLLDFIKDLQEHKGLTILYTSHYMEEVEFLCNRIYIVDRGSVIAEGTQSEIKRIISPQSTYELTVAVKTAELKEQLASHEHVQALKETDEGYRIVSAKNNLFPTLLHMVEDSGTTVKGIHIKQPTLEDVFLHLTGRSLRD
ncbi:ABC transporter ATP-binding protein [Shouchella clausii]|uniref:Multidrug ABC transporter ATP-binding protein n=3 Tax=Shouchella TaxID=2893057 RepID=Q5WJ70_SHOC1|nr:MULTISPECIES: ABC transporter ATP-binding protein [Shouchella]MCM3311728.1 ABC transporter ATP-binding protein [Psychrobacillus sp. MER TA 17]ALA51768.1 Various polyols ABC transporter, ATP-binding component [Shouchella clausii]KKI87213.1 antibiotic ABC transporter ATP-binding protein [Shouchella clausii]MBU3232195.1 ABC transporter ATP-binding protein [Shouchella clausii]MBU3264485.1 ABC transporter ATP-binding protein [Shouchella clausii]